MQTRAFVGRPRCIYTGVDLKDGDPKLRPSHEHIIPLALGGSDQFVTNDVSATANSKAGKEIDDEVASSIPILMLRQKYRFAGNRRVIPSVKLSGEFLDMPAKARMEIGVNAEISFTFLDEQMEKELPQNGGKLILIRSSEDKVRHLLTGRLKQARKNNLNLVTPFGSISDEEDIELALMYADRQEGKSFKANFSLNVAEYHYAIARLMTKISIGLGHRVLGPEWTFGPGGIALRQALFVRPSDPRPRNRGTLHFQMPTNIKEIFGATEDKHVMSVLPVGKKTVATISLFGGLMGTALIDLGCDSRRKFNQHVKKDIPLECVFSIPLEERVQNRRLSSRSLIEVANSAAYRGLLKD